MCYHKKHNYFQIYTNIHWTLLDKLTLVFHTAWSAMINNFPDLITGFDNKNQTNSELRPLITSNVAFDWLFVCLFIYFLFVCFFVKGVKTYETHCTRLPRDRKRECVNNCSISFPLLEDPYLSWKENNRKIISNSGRVTNKKQTTHYNMIPGHLVSSKKTCNERLHGLRTPNESYF